MDVAGPSGKTLFNPSVSVEAGSQAFFARAPLGRQPQDSSWAAPFCHTATILSLLARAVAAGVSTETSRATPLIAWSSARQGVQERAVRVARVYKDQASSVPANVTSAFCRRAFAPRF